MKFNEMLDSNMVPEWQRQYLNYKALDAALCKAIQDKSIKSREKGIDSYCDLIKIDQSFANYFARKCQCQLEKINAFHHEKLSEMKGKYNNLQDQLDQVLSSAVYQEIQPASGHCLEGFSYPSSGNSRLSNTLSSISNLFQRLRSRQSSSQSSETSSNNQFAINCASSNVYDPQDPICDLAIEPTASLSAPKLQSLTVPVPSQPKTSDPVADFMPRRGFLARQQAVGDPTSKGISFTSSSQTTSCNNRPSHFERALRQCEIQSNHIYSRVKSRRSGSVTSVQSKSKIVSCYKKKLRYLKFSFRELYLSLVLLEQYTQLNNNGFEQLLRKYDRMFASTLGRKFYQEHVQAASFNLNLQVIDNLIEAVEHIYTLHFENGNRRRAIKKLQVPANVYKPSSPMLDFRVGYELGMLAVLLIVVLLVGLLSDTGYDWRTVFRLYRSPLLLMIFMFQTGISIVIWKHYKINHVLIFELDLRNNLSFQHFMEFGSVLGIIWSISVLTFLFSESLNIRPSICPLVVVLLIGLFLFNPTASGYRRARFWLLKIIGRIFTAPLKRVRFADFWIADQLVSIVPLFLDLEYLSCFYTTDDVFSVSHLGAECVSRCVTRNPHDLVIRTIVGSLPAWFRCAQCLRRWRDENWLKFHLANAAKYACMVLVVVLSSISQSNKSTFEFDTTRIVWLVAAIFTSCLTAYWDIVYDFGLFSTFDKDDDTTTTTNNNNHDTQTGHAGRLSNAASGATAPSLPGLARASSYRSESIGLFNKMRRNGKTYPFLRKELVYPVWVYYFAIIEDVILRFGWIISISMTEFSNIEAGLMKSMLAPLEMFRRFVWNCIRLENEQLNNCGLFRAVRDIPIEVVAPIDESHLDKVIMMMDSRDGPAMRARLMKRRALRPDGVMFTVFQDSSGRSSS